VVVSKLKIAVVIALMGLMSGIWLTAFSSITTARTASSPGSPKEKDAKDSANNEDKEADDKVAKKMFPDGRDHDFGKVPYGTLCKHFFRIVNTSDAPIEITEVRSA